ncbi:hypothetical protein STEG23_029758, partial [Scotinomys teguina]
EFQMLYPQNVTTCLLHKHDVNKDSSNRNAKKDEAKTMRPEPYTRTYRPLKNVASNLGRVEQVSEFEYDLFIRPDTCNPRFRVWFNFTVENVKESQPYVVEVPYFYIIVYNVYSDWKCYG